MRAAILLSLVLFLEPLAAQPLDEAGSVRTICQRLLINHLNLEKSSEGSAFKKWSEWSPSFAQRSSSAVVLFRVEFGSDYVAISNLQNALAGLEALRKSSAAHLKMVPELMVLGPGALHFVVAADPVGLSRLHDVLGALNAQGLEFQVLMNRTETQQLALPIPSEMISYRKSDASFHDAGQRIQTLAAQSPPKPFILWEVSSSAMAFAYPQTDVQQFLDLRGETLDIEILPGPAEEPLEVWLAQHKFEVQRRVAIHWRSFFVLSQAAVNAFETLNGVEIPGSTRTAPHLESDLADGLATCFYGECHPLEHSAEAAAKPFEPTADSGTVLPVLGMSSSERLRAIDFLLNHASPEFTDRRVQQDDWMRDAFITLIKPIATPDEWQTLNAKIEAIEFNSKDGRRSYKLSSAPNRRFMAGWQLLVNFLIGPTEKDLFSDETLAQLAQAIQLKKDAQLLSGDLAREIVEVLRDHMTSGSLSNEGLFTAFKDAISLLGTPERQAKALHALEKIKFKKTDYAMVTRPPHFKTALERLAEGWRILSALAEVPVEGPITKGQIDQVNARLAQSQATLGEHLAPLSPLL